MTGGSTLPSLIPPTLPLASSSSSASTPPSLSTATSVPSTPALGPSISTPHEETASNANLDERTCNLPSFRILIFLWKLGVNLLLQSWMMTISTQCRWGRNIKGSMVRSSFNVLCLHSIQLLFRVHDLSCYRCQTVVRFCFCMISNELVI